MLTLDHRQLIRGTSPSLLFGAASAIGGGHAWEAQATEPLRLGRLRLVSITIVVWALLPGVL